MERGYPAGEIGQDDHGEESPNKMDQSRGEESPDEADQSHGEESPNKTDQSRGEESPDEADQSQLVISLCTEPHKGTEREGNNKAAQEMEA